MNKRFLWGFFLLVFSALACQPMIVVGWRELFFIFVLIAILIGPPLYRLIRKLEIKSRQNHSEDANKSK